MTYFHIIDRRANPGDKSLPNRQRFLKRHREQLKGKMKDLLGEKSITGGGDSQVTIEGTEEPHFMYDYDTGEWDYVLPGNKEYVPGDKIVKPREGRGQGAGAPGRGKGRDEFTFNISNKEYQDLLFDGLELPDLVKESEKAAIHFQSQRAGFSTSGSASNLALVRTMRNSISRRVGLRGKINEEIAELEEELEKTIGAARDELIAEIERLQARKGALTYIDPLDQRYKRFEKKPIPNNRAVMFCLMDVSGSMGEAEKDVVKRFFILLYLFLTRKYEKVEIVFIRHTDEAEEVDEHTFFHSQESGGTIISSALELMRSIIKERYDPATWNIYGVQASDGDNTEDDNVMVTEELEWILPRTQYYVYTEVRLRSAYGETAMKHMEKLKPLYRNLMPITLTGEKDVIPMFRNVFAKGKHEKAKTA